MATRSVVTCTVGAAGSGKSFRRCAHFIVNEFLPEHDGVHWSNFPLAWSPTITPTRPSTRARRSSTASRTEPRPCTAWTKSSCTTGSS